MSIGVWLPDGRGSGPLTSRLTVTVCALRSADLTQLCSSSVVIVVLCLYLVLCQLGPADCLCEIIMDLNRGRW